MNNRGYRFGNGRPWTWLEVAVLEALLRLGYDRPGAGRLLSRNKDQVAGVCHRARIKLKPRAGKRL